MTKRSLIIYLPEDLWCVANMLPIPILKYIVYDKYKHLRSESERIKLLNEFIGKRL